MPVKSKKKPLSKFNNIDFINYKFDAETKASFNKWFSEKSNTFIKSLYETLQGDYKVSISWDDSAECFIAAMTGRGDSLNPDKCITVRSDDWVKAMAALAYINIEIFSGEIWDVEVATDFV